MGNVYWIAAFTIFILKVVGAVDISWFWAMFMFLMPFMAGASVLALMLLVVFMAFIVQLVTETPRK